MEKKTIGKFISALRRANGMTQKELAEKLFVSDKTVSRWECDECTPDLTLIPVIAEIFGITSDELLRGERRSVEKTEDNENEGSRYSLKGEKQFKTMVRNRLKKYNNLSLISMGLSIVGWLVGLLCNFAFYNGITGFVLGTVLFLASEICQICFARSFRLPLDEEEEVYHVRVQEANVKITQATVRISVLNLALFAFTFPLSWTGGTAGMRFEEWLGFGLICTAVALVLTYIVYTLLIKSLLVKKELLFPNLEKDEKRRKNIDRMSKIGVVVCIVALLLASAVLVVNIIGWEVFAEYETFYDAQSFKEYMEADYDRWFENGHNGEIVVNPAPDVDEFYTYMDTDYIYDENGAIIEYYYSEALYDKIEYLQEYKTVPVRVLTNEAYYTANNIFDDLQSFLWWMIPVDIVIGVAVYGVLWLKDRKK